MQSAEDSTHDIPSIIPTAAQRESNTATVVSPYKSGALRQDTNDQRSHDNYEVDSNQFDIMNMISKNANGVDVAAFRASAAAIPDRMPAVNEGRESSTSVTWRLQNSPEMMIFPEPGFANNQQITDHTVQPTAALLEFDCNDIFGEKYSFDSSKDGDQSTPLRRRHSTDLSSSNDANNLNYKRFKQSHSLPHDYGHLNAAPSTSFGSNSSGLTPIPVGFTPKTAQNETVSLMPNSSPSMPLAHPPKIDTTTIIFKAPPRVFLNPKVSNGGCALPKRHLINSAISYSDIKRSEVKLKLPPQLVPDDKDGRRLVVIHGSSKQCVDTKVDGSNALITRRRQTSAKARKEENYNPGESTMNDHFAFLKSIYPALEGCTFLLPGLKMQMTHSKPINFPGIKIQVSSFGSFKLGHDLPNENGPSKSDLTIAKRRIESAICAFGGCIKRKRSPIEIDTNNTSSIFRMPSNKDKSRKEKRTNAIKKSRKSKNLYHDNGKSLSWEVEADISFDRPDDESESKIVIEKAPSVKITKKIEKAPSILSQTSSLDSKRYKCKLCGQIKQNHVCPFRQTMLRSIGVMAYPSANAHDADEPGEVAPSLCEMNNFVLLGSQSFVDMSFSKSYSFDASGNISKDALISAFERKGIIIDSTKDPVNNLSKAMICKYRQKEPNVTPEHPANELTGKNESDLLFQPKMEITPEQHRLVRPCTVKSSKRAPYSYPPTPMSYSQRESMSDKLFQLSKKVPGLTKECKAVLDEVRGEDDDWDLAVAELMTQVVCVVCCSQFDDVRLEGLSSYLLQLGISC